MKEDYKFNYKLLLTNPEWVKFRKMIIDRDGECQVCGDLNFLQVHHIAYLPYRKPWEYPPEFMLTLCDKCHNKEHNYQKKITDYIEEMRLSGLMSDEIYNIIKK